MNSYLQVFPLAWHDVKAYPLFSSERRHFIMENEFMDLTEQNEEPEMLSLVFDNSVFDDMDFNLFLDFE